MASLAYAACTTILALAGAAEAGVGAGGLILIGVIGVVLVALIALYGLLAPPSAR